MKLYFDSLLDDEPKALVKLLRACCLDVRSPRALSIWILIKDYETLTTEQQGERILELHALEVHPYLYCMADNRVLSYGAQGRRYKDTAQLAGLYKKAIAWPGITDEERDWNTFKLLLETEEHNKQTNQRFLEDGTLLTEYPSIMYYIQKEVARIMGPPPSKGQLADHCDFGPGATFTHSSDESNLFNKLTSLDCTPYARLYCKDLLAVCFPGWEGLTSKLSVSKGNRYFTVPKKYTINRDCRCEPTLNGFLQKGIGSYLRKRAQRKAGILRKTGQDHHRRLAQLGSITESIATEDSKSASNLISIAFVMEAVCPEWFDLLDLARSKKMQVTAPVSGDKIWVDQQLFSSMGNGFTFELESILFYAVAKAVCTYLGITTTSNTLSVYGDDVILPTEASELFRKVALRLGFLPNVEKSFNSGPFRESCGGDYFHGLNVRPHNIEGYVTPMALFVLHNQLVRSGNRYDYPRLHSALIKIIKTTGFGHLKGPDNGSDGHLVIESYPRHMPFKDMIFQPHFYSVDPQVDKKICQLKRAQHQAARNAPSQAEARAITKQLYLDIAVIKNTSLRKELYSKAMLYGLYRQWKGEREQHDPHVISSDIEYKGKGLFAFPSTTLSWVDDPSSVCSTLPFKGIVKRGSGTYREKRAMIF